MKHTFWHRAPMVRLLLPFAGGIGVAMFVQLPLIPVAGMLGLLLLVFGFLHSRYVPYKLQWRNGLLITLACFALGVLLTGLQQDQLKGDHFTKQNYAKQLLIQLDDCGTQKPRTIKYSAHVIAMVDSNHKVWTASGNVMLYLQRDTPLTPASYGDVLVVDRDRVQPVPGPQNPEEFNYKRYLAFHHIHYTAFLPATAIVKTGENKGAALYKWIYSVQAYFKSTLASSIQSANEAGVAQALLYGYDDDIDPDTVDAYAKTGTLHVLAVSGMHVGIIFWILGLLLKPLDKLKQTKALKHVLILLGLWVYSLLCGMSPSILRATVMFSFIVLGEALNRNSNIYNTLAASAFFLLCWDTNILANVGFQLSYMAVLGIVFLQPYIYNWWEPRSWLGDQVWKITSVSLAAQLATSPISLLYFHQFPTCFLVSNLVIIPLTTLILYGGIVLLSVSYWPGVTLLLGKCLYVLIAFTNAIVKYVERIPYAYVEGIQISTTQCVVLYGLWSCALAFLLLRRITFLKCTLLLAIVFFLEAGIATVSQFSQNSITAYRISGGNAIRVFSGTSSLLLMDSTLYANKGRMKFHTQQHYWKGGIENEEVVLLNQNAQALQVAGKQFVIAGSQLPLLPATLDYLYLTRFTDTTALARLHPRCVVLGNTFSIKQRKRLQAFLTRQKIPCYSIAESGAFELNLHE